MDSAQKVFTSSEISQLDLGESLPIPDRNKHLKSKFEKVDLSVNKDLQEHLLACVNLSKESNDESVSKKASAAITALNYLNYSFKDQDLS